MTTETTGQSVAQFSTSPTVGAIFAALSAAQGELEGAKKTAQNPHLRNKYADLASVWDACRGPLAKNGLTVVQGTEPHGRDGVLVITLLGHKSGEWIRGALYMPVGKPDGHGFGSALTYARRYALAAMVGVAPEDDDGNGAVGRVEYGAKPAKREPAPAKAAPTGADAAEGMATEFARRIGSVTTARDLLDVGQEIRRSALNETYTAPLTLVYSERMSELKKAESGKVAP